LKMNSIKLSKGENVYPRSDDDVNKARTFDKGKYGYYGYVGHLGYVPFAVCINMCQLFKQGVTIGEVANRFELGIQDTLSIINTWSKYMKLGMNSTEFSGGKEHEEIKSLKDKKPLTQEDIYEVLMDLEIFSKQKGETQ